MYIHTIYIHIHIHIHIYTYTYIYIHIYILHTEGLKTERVNFNRSFRLIDNSSQRKI